jgi:phage tail-like protein
MPTGTRVDPYRAYGFVIEIGGIERAGFQQCSGLDHSNDVIEYREGNMGPGMHKVPGMARHSNITLRWGITSDPDIWEWRKAVRDGSFDRQNISVILLSEKGEEVRRWDLVEAWCTKLTMPSLNATSNEIAIETMEIAYENLVES